MEKTKSPWASDGKWCLVRIISGRNGGPLSLSGMAAKSGLGYPTGFIGVDFVRLESEEEADLWVSEDAVYPSAHTEKMLVEDLHLSIYAFRHFNGEMVKFFDEKFSDKFYQKYYEAYSFVNGFHRAHTQKSGSWQLLIECQNGQPEGYSLYKGREGQRLNTIETYTPAPWGQ